MERLRAADTALLGLERASAPLHAVAVVLLGPGEGSGRLRLQRIVDRIAARADRLPVLRRRVREVPFGLGPPVWVEAPHFRVESHVRRVCVPRPGTQRELGELVASIASTPFDRSRPLWELWLLEGLEDGGSALVSKTHLAATDGSAKGDLLAQLLDLEPVAAAERLPRRREPAASPSDVGLVLDAALDVASHPARLVGLAWSSLGAAAGRLAGLLPGAGNRNADAGDERVARLAGGASWRGAVDPSRSVAFGHVSIDDARRAARAFAIQLNDVMLAACTRSLRVYLRRRGDPPAGPLLAAIPVFTRAPRGSETGVTVIRMPLPVHLDDVGEQVAEIVRETREWRRRHRALRATTLGDWRRAPLPAVFARAARGLLLAELRQPESAPDLVVFNLPGPSTPLYAAGAPVRSVVPLAPLCTSGLAVTLAGSLEGIECGVVACREGVPFVEEIAAGFAQGVRDLLDAADESARKPASRGEAERDTLPAPVPP